MENNNNPTISNDHNEGKDNQLNAIQINPQFDSLDNPVTIVKHLHTLKNSSLNDYSNLEVKPTDNIPLPKIAWKQVIDDKYTILGTLGNLSLLIGKAKSRKSFFVGITVSTLLSAGKHFNQFVGCLPHDKKKVLYFDTEQGKYHVQLALKRICKQIGQSKPQDLKVYYLRSKKPEERLSIIEDIIYKTKNLGFVVIDGIKDLVTSINDEAEATNISSKLLKWTEELDIHIISVLHQNKSDNNARGHIGTELINKAETVLSVTKNEHNDNISVVEAQMCRNKDPEPFAFEINEDGMPVLVDDYKIKTESRRKKFDILDLEDYKKYQILTEVFSKENSLSYSELVIQVKIAFKNQYDNKLGDNRAKELITICKNKNWLLQEKNKAPYTLGEYNEGVEDDFQF
ncbi:AAA family ATPase [Psychroflexus montanilacus]|uniref:AAA family ATPase n=1 Tax=Psychroflexus montanilacus TaxID=2873598 RepID=UPI001CCA787C|nr:AAA family ATPase [Psychroflexus montanilacus]MBZ9650621.1 AAA family ATPase [Psychroflexus montanilacus]